MRLSEALEGLGNPVAYHPGLRKVCGSVTATVLFCQLFYWKGKGRDGDGWIYKDSTELEEETGLSYKEQATARKQLVKNGLIKEKYDRLAHKMYFRINEDSLNSKWEVPETPNGEFPKPPTGSSGNAQSAVRSYTENTTENTTEIFAKNKFSQDVPSIIEKFKELSPSLTYGNKTQRKACEEMISLWGAEETLRMVDQVLHAQMTDKYCPRAVTPLQMWKKIGELKVYFRGKTQGGLPTFSEKI